MSQSSPQWKKLNSEAELQHVINESKYKPALVLKHDPLSAESNKIKRDLESNWTIPLEEVNLFIIQANKQLGIVLSEVAEVEDETPQIVLFADGVTMYDEANDLISFKKVKLALKIVNRTFKWIETRA